MSAAAIQYWRERLEDVCPYYKDSWLGVEHATLYSGNDRPRWPMAVNTVTLYSDFLAWWHDRYLLPICGEPPRPPHVRAFFGTLKDFLFINGRRVKQKRVPVPRFYCGSMFTERKNQRFVYLSTWREHVDVFEKLTQSRIKMRIGVDAFAHIV